MLLFLVSFFIVSHSSTRSLRILLILYISFSSVTPFHHLLPSQFFWFGSVGPVFSGALFLYQSWLLIKALPFLNNDWSITKLHLHIYCCPTPCAKCSFVNPSPIRCLHLVEIVFFQPEALPSIQAGLRRHKQHTAVLLGKLIVKGRMR